VAENSIDDPLWPKLSAEEQTYPVFRLGTLVATPAALRALEAAQLTPQRLLQRHVTGDWAEMSRSDQAANAEAVQHGARVFSAYLVGAAKVWIITEADRSSTCILLPSDY
jgi:hypothetical protein